MMDTPSTGRKQPSRWLTLVWAGLILVLAQALLAAAPGSRAPQALMLEIEGTIGPVTAEYFRHGLDRADELGADVVILRLDTPGGLDAAMRDIVKEILASPLPVVGFVGPSGARAASAGTYLLYAAHVAAMAPATNLGSATPVKIGGLPGLPEDSGTGDDQGKANESPPVGSDDDTASKPAADETAVHKGNAMDRKIINDAAAFIRGLAKLRGRNAEWAERAVRRGENLTSDEAFAQGVVDVIATDVEDLMARIDGRSVRVLGDTVTLRTANVKIEAFEPDWRTRILAVITNPNIAYVLMLIGIYGLIYELANPGAIVPGVIGAIALLTALYAFQALPVNYAGLALLVIGIAFMTLEAFVPSFGALGIGGAIAFVIGSVILYSDDSGQFQVAIPLVATFAALSIAMFVWVIGYALRTRRRPVVSGAEGLLHATAIVESDMHDAGRVRVHSESWLARSAVPLRKGQRVTITGIDGLNLTVEPEQEEKDHA